MIAKALNESAWRALAQKFKIKDASLQKELAAFAKIKPDDFAALLKSLAVIKDEALSLKKSKEIASNSVVTKYLADMLAAADAQLREVAKDKLAAEKAQAVAKAQAAAAEKAQAAAAKTSAKKAEEADEEEDDEEDSETEELTGNYQEQLLAMLKKLKATKDAVWQFVVCEGKPPCVMVAKRITASHKKQLAEITGKKLFRYFGTCTVTDGKFDFRTEKPVPGLAKRLRAMIKIHTGKKFAIKAGDESVEEEDETPGGDALAADMTDAGAPDGLAPDGAEAAEASEAGGETPVKPPSGPFSIDATVGRGGKNKAEDVLAVQAALNRRVDAKLVEDGVCGPKTIAAITEFQKAIGLARPDGRIEPGRGTARALASNEKIGPPPEPAMPEEPPELGEPDIDKAPAVWHRTRSVLDKNIRELKKAIRNEYAHEHPELLKDVEGKMTKMDRIMEKLDRRLAEALEKAGKAGDAATQARELENARAILRDYSTFADSEPLIAHLDENPFGVKTNLRRVLTDSLKHMNQVIEMRHQPRRRGA